MIFIEFIIWLILTALLGVSGFIVGKILSLVVLLGYAMIVFLIFFCLAIPRGWLRMVLLIQLIVFELGLLFGFVDQYVSVLAH